MSSLKQQFSRDRRTLGHSSELIDRKRMSYGHSTAGRKLKFMKVDLVSSRVRKEKHTCLKKLINFQEYMVEEQNQIDESCMMLSEQAESMPILINTTNFGYSHIKVKMGLTYPHRQRLVQEMKPIKEIVNHYPALSINDLVSLRISDFSI